MVMAMRGGQGWGPSHQTRRRRRSWRWWLGRTALTVVMLDCLGVLTGSAASTALDLVCLVAVGVFVARRHRGWRRRRPRRTIDPAAEVARLGGGTYLGLGGDGAWRVARATQALLVIGPPQSGKTSAVMIPAVLSHTGPVVSTSTKPDVLTATCAARSTRGPMWEFDPCGQTADATGCRALRWSPVSAAGDWDGAIRVARAMVAGGGAGTGTTDSTHWSKRAAALLAVVLHAAAVAGRDVDAAVGWVLSHEFDEPGAILEAAGAGLACGLLRGLVNTEARERSSICSAAADALDAYSSQAALAAACDPNFDPDAFVGEGGTVYVHAPGELQGMAAPLICGLLSEIRRATYQAARAGGLAGRVLFALDEAANIAPLAELPSIASEGGGQGLTLLAAFQDLSQARGRGGAGGGWFFDVVRREADPPGGR
jgi:type IV secretion system protein VirD4